MAHRKPKSEWRRGGKHAAEFYDRLENNPASVLLRAKDFCDHYGLSFDDLKRENMAGGIKVYVMPDDNSLAIYAEDAIAWLRRRRAMN